MYFQRLDGKLETLSQAGLVSAIVPIRESGQSPRDLLPEDQAALFIRYMLARWGSEPVVWLLMIPPEQPEKNIQRWKNIGRLAFSESKHAPVVVYAQDTARLFDQLREEKWVDAFAFPTTLQLAEQGFKPLWGGPVGREWTNEPARPLIPFLPCENSEQSNSVKRVTAEEMRVVALSSLLQVPPVGLSYCGQDIPNWNGLYDALDYTAPGIPPSLQIWYKAMFMPGASQLGNLANLLKGVEFWKLRPNAAVVTNQPGMTSPRSFISAARTETKDHALVYTPRARSVELNVEELPPSPEGIWFDPRTGDTTPAPSISSGTTLQFPTPDKGDWLLVVRINPAR
jgi:hypothetical protein